MNKGILQKQLSKNAKPFLQPLALIVVCIIFVSLILSIGLMDLRRIDKTLIGFMQNRGMDIIGNIQRVAQGNYSNLIQLIRGDHGTDTIAPFTDETFLPQEALINSLVSLCRRIDQSWDTERGKEDRTKIAEREGLWLLVVLDKESRIVFENRPTPGRLLYQAAPVISGKKEIIVDLFSRSGKNERLGFVAVRRSSGSGSILIALDDACFHFWGTRIAIQRAIEDAGWGKGVAYISVMNPQGMSLGSAGDLVEDWNEEAVRVLNDRKDETGVSHRKISFRGKEVLEVTGPIHLDGEVVGLAHIGLERDRTDLILRENRINMYISMFSVMLVGLLSIWILFYNQNRHLARIEEMSKRLQQSERLSSLGQLAAGVAHEIRNPLNAISMASQRLQREYLPGGDPARSEEFLRLTGIIRDEIRRLNAIIEEFLNFSRRDRLELREYPIEDVLQKLIGLVEEEARSRGITIRRGWDHSKSLVPMDIDKLQQALLNIIKNAMESISREGSITISIEPTGNRSVDVMITDTGVGLTAEEIDRIFSPEYTTKEKGLGLGLPIAHEIIRAHGGEIRVHSRIGSGTTFQIRLPVKA
ncbi:MAG: nitrogen regulation protein NR(II) [Syntrophales bacterium]